MSGALNSKMMLGLKQSIRATFADIDLFCAQVKKLLADANLNRQNFTAQLLLREALTNAVQHGSRCDPTKTIECEFIIERDMLIIVVSDDGDGFDWEAAGKGELDTKSTTGRGVNILRIYSNEITYNQKGNRITIKRKIREGEE